MKRLTFLLPFIILFALSVGDAKNSHIKPVGAFELEVWAPPGMPFQLTTSFTENNIFKITKTFAGEATKVSILIVPLNSAGELIRGDEVNKYRVMSDEPRDPMTWGTADQATKKVLVIPEWVQFNTGQRWVINADHTNLFDEDPRSIGKLKELIAKGKSDLPTSRIVEVKLNNRGFREIRKVFTEIPGFDKLMPEIYQRVRERGFVLPATFDLTINERGILQDAKFFDQSMPPLAKEVKENWDLAALHAFLCTEIPPPHFQGEAVWINTRITLNQSR